MACSMLPFEKAVFPFRQINLLHFIKVAFTHRDNVVDKIKDSIVFTSQFLLISYSNNTKGRFWHCNEFNMKNLFNQPQYKKEKPNLTQNNKNKKIAIVTRHTASLPEFSFKKKNRKRAAKV